MTTEPRKKLKNTTETDVLRRSRRRCCLCVGLHNDYAEKRGQIAHLDKDRGNNQPHNLAFLCLDHHDAFDGRTSQSKGYTLQEVRTYRDQLHQEFEKYSPIVSQVRHRAYNEVTDKATTALSYSGLLGSTFSRGTPRRYAFQSVVRPNAKVDVQYFLSLSESLSLAHSNPLPDALVATVAGPNPALIHGEIIDAFDFVVVSGWFAELRTDLPDLGLSHSSLARKEILDRLEASGRNSFRFALPIAIQQIDYIQLMSRVVDQIGVGSRFDLRW